MLLQGHVLSTQSKSKELDGAVTNSPQAGTVRLTLWASLEATVSVH